jgi:hypothetical protein
MAQVGPPHTPRRRKPSNIPITEFIVGKFLTAVTSYDRRQHSGSLLGDLGLTSLIILGEGKNRLFTPLAITPLILHLLIACRWMFKFTLRPLYVRERSPLSHSTGGSLDSTANLDVLKKKKCPAPAGIWPWDHTQPPLQWVPGLCPRGKAAGA